MKQRNPEATCATCVYGLPMPEKCFEFGHYRDGVQIECRRHPADSIHEIDYYCGEHPDFFLEDDDGMEQLLVDIHAVLFGTGVPYPKFARRLNEVVDASCKRPSHWPKEEE